EDLAGNVTTRSVTLRLDDTAPVFAAVPTAVRDERSDVIGFSGVEPTHRHLGPAVTIGTEGCPDVYKHAYLLDEAAPAYGGELDGRNPLRWRLRLTDDGVGIEPVGAQVRVKVAGAGGATLLDWTEVTGTDLGGGVQEYDLTLYRAGGAAPLTLGALGTVEGALELELRGRDRFGREVTGARCWTHHPLAAPLHVGEAYTPGVGGHPAHALALMAHGLDSGRTQDLSTLLLNPGATGASVMDSLISNGTAEAVYLRVTLAAPPTAAITRAFSIGHEPVSVEDTDDSCAVDPGACLSVPATITQAESFPAAPVPFELRLFSASATGVPGAEVQPCQEPGCMNTPTVRTYRIAPRVDATIPRYLATAWLKQATALRPANAAYPAEPPFAEFVQAARLYTGKQTDADFCSRTADRGIPRVTYCTQRTYYKRRQSLDSATIGLNSISTEATSSASPLTISKPAAPSNMVDFVIYTTIEQ
ncbi:MAG TPA: hypothetical protein PKU97_04320, partial [Kofleriaceae bacterium]|nr:hypothetical protein [Kofleriaceae bacterium]